MHSLSRVAKQHHIVSKRKELLYIPRTGGMSMYILRLEHHRLNSHTCET